jgi:uncharacterized membrane protein YkvA (DUF1232 family)
VHFAASTSVGHWLLPCLVRVTSTAHIAALLLAARDPRVPWYAKVVAATVASYAPSPIDLIPDFIPVLGYVDDLIIARLGRSSVLRASVLPHDERYRITKGRKPWYDADLG